MKLLNVIQLIVILIIIISIVLESISDHRLAQKHDTPTRKIAPKIHILFPGQIALAVVATILSVYWFVANQDPFIDYGRLWNIIEKGSMDAMTAVMGLVGVGSLLLGWINNERESLTLGKSQAEMIHLRFGAGYSISVVVHFGMTALSLLMLHCKAREPALWSFLAVAWGCIPQAGIYLQIVMNRKNRENYAIALWKADTMMIGSKEAESWVIEIFHIIRKMSGYLSEQNVRHHTGYSDVLSGTIAMLVCNGYGKNPNSHNIKEAIKDTSVVFRVITENIPQQEQEYFEESIIRNVCKHIQQETSFSQAHITDEVNALNIFCCGYIRFLYVQAEENRDHRINVTMQYFQQGDPVFRNFGNILCDYYYGLAWFSFLAGHEPLPKSPTKKCTAVVDCGHFFVSLILSIFEEPQENNQKLANIAWKQVELGGEG